MQILISDHALDSLKDRLGCSPKKYEKIVTKAWKSKERVLDGDIANRMEHERNRMRAEHIVYRKFMGKIYVFDDKGTEQILITVMPSAIQLTKTRMSKARALKYQKL